MPKLTKRIVDALKPDARDRIVWDSELPRFGVRVKPTGARTWIVQYRVGAGTRRLSLGAVGAVTPEAARKLALQRLGEVAAGADPSGERQRPKAGTVRDLCKRFLESGQGAKAEKLAPATARKYKTSLERHVLPIIGRRRLEELRRQDLLAVRSKAAEAGPIAANRAYRALSAAWSWGQGTGQVPETLALPKMPAMTERRDRGQALTPEELGRLGAALEALPAGPPRDALVVYLLSGCRPAEILRATWADLHQDGRRLLLPASKTGPRTVYLGSIPAEIIARQAPSEERDPAAPIFASTHQRNPRGPLTSLDNAGWRKARKAAGLDPSIRLYDAGRHTFTTRAYELGYAEHVVRKLTGHAESDIGGAHGRYRHLSPTKLLEAAEAVSASLWSDLQGKGEEEAAAGEVEPAAELAEVIELEARR